MAAPPVTVSPWLWVGLILPVFYVLNQGAKLVTDKASLIARRCGRSTFVIGVRWPATALHRGGA